MPVVKREQPKRGLTKEASQVFYNQMMIVLSGVEAGEPYGEIVHWYLETPVPYHGLAELIFRLEGIALCGADWQKAYEPSGENPDQTEGRGGLFSQCPGIDGSAIRTLVV